MGYKDKQIADALRVAKRARNGEENLESFQRPDLRRDSKGEVYNPEIAPRRYGDDVRDWRTRKGLRGHEKGYNPWLDPENMYTNPTEERHDPKDPLYHVSPEEFRKGVYGHQTYALASGGRAKFADGGSAEDVSNFVSQVYKAYMGREPDASGKEYWSSQISSGKIKPEDFIQTVRNTPESKERAQQVVASAYQSLLGRNPDETGLNYWTQQLQSGVPLSKIEGILKATPEGQEKTRADVYDSFAEILGREPDPEGLDYWTDQVRKGMPLSQFREIIGNTPEARTVQAEQITDLYRDYLGRDPDPEGLQFFQNAITSGSATLGDVENTFAESPEAQSYAQFAGPVNSVFQTYLGREPTDQEINQLSRNTNLDALIQAVSESPEAQQYTNQLIDIQHQATGLPRQEIAASISLSRRNKRHTPSEQAQAEAPVSLPVQIYDTARKLWDTGNEQLKEWMPGLIGQEGGAAGWNAAAKTSSAKGPFQFLTGTWNDQFAKIFGEQMGITARDLGSYTRNGRYVPTALGRKIAALRTDTSPDGKALSMAMGLTFNQDNAEKLRSEGLPVTPENVYSVHFSGNTKLARAGENNPGASAGSILGGAAVRANKFLSGLSAAKVLEKFKTFVTDPRKVAMGENVISGYQEARGQTPALQTSVSYGDVDPSLFPQQKQPPATPTTTTTSPTTTTTTAPTPAPAPGMAEYEKAMEEYRQAHANWAAQVRNWQIMDAINNKGKPAGGIPYPLAAAEPKPPNPANYGYPSGGTYAPTPQAPAPSLQPINPGAFTTIPGGGMVNPGGTPTGTTPTGITPLPGTTGSTWTPQPAGQGAADAFASIQTMVQGNRLADQYSGVMGTGGGPGMATPSGLPSFGGGATAGPSSGFGVSYMKKGGSVKPYKDEAINSALRVARASGGRSPAWTRKEGQNPEGGLNAKGRASAKAEGSNLKPPAPNPKTDKDAARRKSFCARMKGMKSKLTSSETANDPDSRINKSLRAWNCREYGGVIDDALRIAKGGEVWDKPRPKSLGEPEALSKRQKRSAKAAAKAAGRPWPNLVDNMRAAQRKK